MSNFQNGTNPLTVFPLELWEVILDHFSDSKDIRSFLTAYPQFGINNDVLSPNSNKILAGATTHLLKPKRRSAIMDRFMERKGYRNKNDFINISTEKDIQALHHGVLRSQPLTGKLLAIELKVGKDSGSFFITLLKFLEEFGESFTSADMRFTVELVKVKVVQSVLKSIVGCLSAMKNLRVLTFQFKTLDFNNSKQPPTAAFKAAFTALELCTEYPSLPNLEHLTVLKAGNLSSTLLGYFARCNLPANRLSVSTSLPETDYALIEASFPNVVELETTVDWKFRPTRTPFYTQLRSLTKLTITQFSCGASLYQLFETMSELNIKYLTLSNTTDDMDMFARPYGTAKKVPSVEYLSICDGRDYGFDFVTHLANLKHLVVNTSKTPDFFSKSEIAGRNSRILAQNIMYDLSVSVSSTDSIWKKSLGLKSVELDHYKQNILQFFL